MAIETKENPTEDIRVIVREHYGKAAQKTGCGCGEASLTETSREDSESVARKTSCCGEKKVSVQSNAERLYALDDVQSLPEEVTEISLGCGDPVTLASLQNGQVVLDLGSGGGIDCFLAAKKVGSTGKVIGVDMTPEMIDLARENKRRLGAENVEFRLGEIEHLPVADNTVDVVISNCVINLSPDKPQVFAEAFRVLKPGGKLSVSDIVTDGTLPEEIKKDLSAWAGCVAGAWDAKDYAASIEDAGFEAISLVPQYFDEAELADALEQLDQESTTRNRSEDLKHAIYSAKVTARKPTG